MDFNQPTDFVIRCRFCLDAGRVHPVKENGKPDFTQVVDCRHCTPPEKITRQLGVSSMAATFDTIKPVKGMGAAVKAAQQMSTLNTDFHLLLIYGENGNGKTMILEALSIALWNKGVFARVETFPDFMGRLKATFDRSKEANDQNFEGIMNTICATPYLLMDDVGQADSYTEWSKQQLERIMLARYRNNLFTVMTTNKDLKELPLMVLSRFQDGEKSRLVLNAAPDYRPLKGGK